ncbi:MAG: PLP-dependent aminotransferase family protein [Termitinemataceae bacterium]
MNIPIGSKFSLSLTDTENPLYLQLADQLRLAISRGDVADGERLPSIRQLSTRLNINPATVVAAYRILEQEGFVRSRPGSGIYACRSNFEDHVLENLSPFPRSILPNTAFDLAAPTPSPDQFPVQQFKGICNEILDRDGGWAFEYQPSAGWLPFRDTLRAYARETLCIESNAELIWIVSGAQQGIDITAKALLHPGDRVLVEEPTYRGALAAFWSRGADTIPVPLTRKGMDMDILEKRITTHRPVLIYIQSRFQNPSTISWSREHMETLLKWADTYEFYILEDDLLSDLYFYQKPDPLTMKSLDTRDRVIYVRGFSKVLLPGLRLGMLVVPPQLQQSFELAKLSTDIYTDGFLQRAVDLYMRRNLHIDRMDELRQAYRSIYDSFVSAVRTHLEPLGCSFLAPQGGLHLWITLPENTDWLKLQHRAQEQKLMIPPLDVLQSTKYLRLSFACIQQEMIQNSIQALAECL